MDAIAHYRGVKSSAQKIRLIANKLRGKKILQALEEIDFINKKAAYLLKIVLKSASSNAQHNNNSNIEDLIISKILVNNGPSMKRSMPRAKGRSNLILKRTSHITVIVSDYLK